MHSTAKFTTLALVAALALTLGACGDRDGGGDGSAANITFRTDPRGVDVWIDGAHAGTTPVVIALEAGSHDVTLKREGFDPIQDKLEVEAGKDLTVTSALAVTGSPEERVGTLLAALDIPEHEDLDVEVTRGSPPPVLLYWPRRDVRKEGLTTWRLEILEYDDDGALVFKKGRQELYRQPFRATGMVMEGPLPPAVMEALKRGARITWGIDFENKRKKDIMATFVVKDGRSLERKLDKLERRSVFQRAKELEQQIARIELKRNYRFYTEALTDAMSVLNTWPETLLADKVIADALQRLDLKESTLYTEIMSRLRGKGASRAGGGLGAVSRPMPLAMVAPKVPTQQAGGEAPTARKGGTLGVTPTGGDEKRGPGPIEDEAAAGGATDSGERVQPGGTAQPDHRKRRDRRADERELADLAARREALEAAEDEARGADEALQAAADGVAAAREAMQAAEAAAETAREGGDASQIEAAEAALRAAREAEQEATQAEQAARQAHEAAEQTAREAREALGAPEDEIRGREERLRERLEGADERPTRDREAIERELAEAEKIRERLDQAREQTDAARDAHAAANELLGQSRQAVEDAQKALDDAQESGDGAAIEAAQTALDAARAAEAEAAQAEVAARKAEAEAEEAMRTTAKQGGADSPERVRERERRLRRELDRASGVGTNPLVREEPGAEQQHLAARLDQARRILEHAKQDVQSTSTALEAAQARFQAADDLLSKLEDDGADADRIAEAEADFVRAQEELTRAQMEAARAQGAAEQAARAVKDAQARSENQPPQEANR